jgi:2-amino-4-hydroxy-6-hydroxymethyldihydropteridine diphosphokinase
MAIAYLGIGSNLGNREENIDTAIKLLEENQIAILKRSTTIETDPVGGPPGQGKFLNAVLKVRTEFPPQPFLHLLKQIEQTLGRTVTVPNGPRPIDLDILIYDNLQWHTPDLTIPHPRMLERHFVMRPLKEIAPDLVKELVHAHR